MLGTRGGKHFASNCCTAGECNHSSILRLLGVAIASNDLETRRIRLHRSWVNAFTRPVIGNALDRRDHRVALHQCRHPVCGRIGWLIAVGSASKQRLVGARGVGSVVAEKRVQMRGIWRIGKHDGIVVRRMAQRTLNQKLRHTTLRACDRLVGSARQRTIQRSSGIGHGCAGVVARTGAGNDAQRQQHSDGQSTTAHYGNHGAGFAGTLIAATSIFSGTSVAGRAGAVAASGMFAWLGGSGDDVL